MLSSSLNLLPPEKKEALQKIYIFAYAQTMVFLLSIVIVFATVLLIPVRLILADDYENLLRQTSPAQDEYTVAISDISTMNSFLMRIEEIQKRLPSWTDALILITGLIPENVRLNNLTINDDGVISMRGSAANRSDLLELQDNLKKSPLLSDVTSPLSNILQKKDVRFDLNMRYLPPKSE